MISPFDAVLLISFGGPGSRDEIRPFLRNVLRNRQIPERRFEAVVTHYEQFDGVSPLTEITMRQAAGLRARLASGDPPLPVYVGMRNWHPFLEDTLLEMSQAGVQRVLGITLAPHHCYSSCGQYKQNVVTARQHLRRVAEKDIEITYVGGWHDHPRFIEAHAAHISDALSGLPREVRNDARIVFTAHSIPQSMADVSRYEAELNDSARRIAESLNRSSWTLVYQSRSGRPQDPWLGPDVCEYLKAERERGLRAVVLSPIGFVADHVEVLYDLDQEAAAVCREIGLEMTRAAATNDDPLFLDMLADVVRTSMVRYGRGLPLPLVPSSEPPRTEPPPPER